jgi:tetratricopeptide (TPR) repeat protein
VHAVLRVLVASHLLQEHVPGRYRMHDLLRLYAGELLDEDSQSAAFRRLMDFYLHSASGAARLIRPERRPIDLPQVDCEPQTFQHRAAATSWFDLEHSCLLASVKSCAQRGWHASVWQLAWALSAFHVMRGYLVDDLEVWRAAAVSAQKLDDPVTHAIAHLYLGTAYARMDHHADAVGHLRQARAVAEQADAVAVLADIHRTLGWVWEQQGDVTLALPHTHRALQLYRTAGNRMREADALNSAGWLHAQLGQYQRAATYCEQALVLCRQHDHPRGEAITLDSLGYIARQLGHHEEALKYYGDALTLVRATDNTYDEAEIQTNLGDACHAVSQYTEARRAWQRAHDLCLAQHRTRNADDLSRKLAALPESEHVPAVLRFPARHLSSCIPPRS